MLGGRPVEFERCKDPNIMNIRVAWFITHKGENSYLYGGCIHATDGWCLKQRKPCTTGKGVIELNQAYELNFDPSALPEKYIIQNDVSAWVQLSTRERLKDENK